MAGIFLFCSLCSTKKLSKKNFPKITLIYKIPGSGNQCTKVLEQLLMRFPCPAPTPQHRVEWDSAKWHLTGKRAKID